MVVLPENGRHADNGHDLNAATGATAVPFDMLIEVLVEGRAVIEFAVLGLIDDLLRENALGPWKVGLGTGADKIDLCEPAADTSATA